MTPLEVMKRLAEHPLDESYAEQDACPFCGYSGGHELDCPWRSIERVVQALEAAEAFYRVCAALHWGETLDYSSIMEFGRALGIEDA